MPRPRRRRAVALVRHREPQHDLGTRPRRRVRRAARCWTPGSARARAARPASTSSEPVDTTATRGRRETTTSATPAAAAAASWSGPRTTPAGSSSSPDAGVLAPAPDVRAARAGRPHHRDLVERIGEAADGVLERDDRVGGRRHGGARHDARRLAGGQRRVEGGAGRQVGDDLKPHRAVGRGIRHIGEAHREPVHRGVVEHRDVDARAQRLAQRAAARGRDRHRAGRDRR